MLFNSLDFLVFLIVVTTLFSFVRTNEYLSKVVLLLASVFFYGYWSWYYLALIYFTICYDFFLGKKINSAKRPKLYLVLSVGLNLSVLFFFKYIDFIINSFNYINDSYGWIGQLNTFDWLLPVGISFYTFQSMSYSIDIYRREIKPRNSLLDYALFISFFPQLVAGPIIRAKTFFSQLDNGFSTSQEKSKLAFFIILVGFVQKMVFADGLATVIDPIFATPETYGGLETLLAVYAYGFQIYFDFAGYTNIAIGVALSFGFEFPTNFRFPYVSLSFKEFWQRWHISLSTWLKDYLYISMGGNRFGFLLTLRNLMITMLIGGLWHGASWNFVIWGGLHGLYLVVEKVIDRFVVVRLLPKPLKWLVVFNAVCFAWVFFRAGDLSDSLIIINNIFNTISIDMAVLSSSHSIFIIFLPVFHYFFSRIDLVERFEKMRLSEIVIWQTLCLILLLYFGLHNSESFIYFQF